MRLSTVKDSDQILLSSMYCIHKGHSYREVVRQRQCPYKVTATSQILPLLCHDLYRSCEFCQVYCLIRSSVAKSSAIMGHRHGNIHSPNLSMHGVVYIHVYTYTAWIHILYIDKRGNCEGSDTALKCIRDFEITEIM